MSEPNAPHGTSRPHTEVPAADVSNTTADVSKKRADHVGSDAQKYPCVAPNYPKAERKKSSVSAACKSVRDKVVPIVAVSVAMKNTDLFSELMICFGHTMDSDSDQSVLV